MKINEDIQIDQEKNGKQKSRKCATNLRGRKKQNWSETAKENYIPKTMSTFFSVGEGDGGMFQENSIETCILSRVKQITSPGWMTSAQTWCTGKTQSDLHSYAEDGRT